MVRFQLLSGKQAGTSWGTRRFPVRIGRSPKAQIQIDESGVWDLHLQIASKAREGFLLTLQPEALATVNGQPVKEALLRNGDVIEFGSARLQFWIADAPRLGLRYREWLTWALVVGISLGQVCLVYWLLSL